MTASQKNMSGGSTNIVHGDRLESYFKKCKASWLEKWSCLSDERKYENDEYDAIVELGKLDPEILINDLDDIDGDWFVALSQVMEDDPFKDEEIFGFDELAERWKAWWVEGGKLRWERRNV